MATWIVPYNRYSQSAKSLGIATGFKRATAGRGIKQGDTILNWGSSEIHLDTRSCVILNDPRAVQQATNKLRFFQRCGDKVRTVPWTTDKGIALEWGQTGNVVARTVLTGHSGNGIVIIPEGSDEIVDAPLYTQYVKSAAEYRIHIAFGQVIDVQRKVRDPGREPLNWQVRSHQNGFIYIRNGVEPPDGARTEALSAILACDLDFGAVDVICKRDGTAYVLEINCAPGLEGQTVTSYTEAFRNALNAN